MPNFTDNLNIPFPKNSATSWYSVFKDMISQIDNHLFSMSDRNGLVAISGSTVSWDASTSVLQWSSDIVFISPTTGTEQILAANSVTIQDGEFAQVTLQAGPVSTVNLSVVVVSTIAVSTNTLMFAHRSGSSITLWTGRRVSTGSTESIYPNPITAHSGLSSLSWSLSGHTGTTDSVAMWDGGGNPVSTTVTALFNLIDHAGIGVNLAWSLSGHTGASNSFAGWDVNGVANVMSFAAAAGLLTHSNIGVLGWTSSGHTGTINSFAGFDGTGVASDFTPTALAGALSHASLGAGMDWANSGHTGGGFTNVFPFFDGAGNPWYKSTAGIFAVASHTDIAWGMEWSVTGHTGTANNFAGFDGTGAALNLTGTAAAGLLTHSNIGGLAWSTSGHTGTANNFASFNGAGVAVDLSATALAGMLSHSAIGSTLSWSTSGHSGVAGTIAGFGATSVATGYSMVGKGKLLVGGTNEPVVLASPLSDGSTLVSSLAATSGLKWIEPAYFSRYATIVDITSAAKTNIFGNTGGDKTTPTITASNVNWSAVTASASIINAGIYEVNISLYVAVSSSTLVTFSVEVNAIQKWSAIFDVNSAVDPVERSVSIIIQANAADSIVSYVTSSTASTITVQPGTSMTIKRIG